MIEIAREPISPELMIAQETCQDGSIWVEPNCPGQSIFAENGITFRD